MVRYAMWCFAIAVIAAVVGFSGIAGGATVIAKSLVLLFSVLGIVILLLGLIRPD